MNTKFHCTLIIYIFYFKNLVTSLAHFIIIICLLVCCGMPIGEAIWHSKTLIYSNTPTSINIKILILCSIFKSLVTFCIILYLSLGFYQCPSHVWRSGFWRWWHLFPELGSITINYYWLGIINVALPFTFSYC